MLFTAIKNFLKGKAIMSSFSDHLRLRLSKTDMKFMSGFPFVKAYEIVEHMLVTG